MRDFHSIAAKVRGWTPLLSSRTANRSRPASLASYMSMSARARMFSVRAAAAAKVTTPMLAVTRRAAPSSVRLLSRTRSTMESATWPAPERSASGRRMANSSPPRRATRSVSRSDPRRRAATETMSSSPASCPRVSLTSLKWSRSMRISAPVGPERAQRARCSSRARSNRRRLGSPVRTSWSARWASCCSYWRRSDTSTTLTRMTSSSALGGDDPARQRHVDVLAEGTRDGPLAGDARARLADGLVEVAGHLEAVVGGEVAERAADDGVDPAADHRRQRLVDLQDDAAQVEHGNAVGRVGDEALGAGVGAPEVVEAAVLVGDVTEHEERAVGHVGGAVRERRGIDRDEARLAGVHVVGLDDEAADRLAGQGDPRGSLPRGEDRAVDPAARRGDVGVEPAGGAVLGDGEPAAGRVVVQDHAAVAVEDDEGVGDRLGDDPQVLGLPARGAAGIGDVDDEAVALPLGRREHEREHRREEHEGLQRQRLSGGVADVAERAARGREDEDERHEGGERPVERRERHGEAQAAPHEDGEREEGQRDRAPGPEDEPEDEQRHDDDRDRLDGVPTGDERAGLLDGQSGAGDDDDGRAVAQDPPEGRLARHRGPRDRERDHPDAGAEGDGGAGGDEEADDVTEPAQRQRAPARSTVARGVAVGEPHVGGGGPDAGQDVGQADDEGGPHARHR